MPVSGSPLPTDHADGDPGHSDAHNATNQRVNDLQTQGNATETAVAGKAAASHTHTIANVTGLQSALDGKADVGAGGGGAPTGGAGGVLSGTYPNPGFATDMATQAELDSAIAGRQPIDPDLTTIAGLDSSTAGALATDGSGWVRKTYAQLKTSLGLTKADVGLGNVANLAPADLPVSTATQTALDAKQAADSDLTALAELGDGYPRRVSGTWQAQDAAALASTLGVSSGGGAESGPAGARLRAALASRNAGPRVLVFCGSSTTAGNNASTAARRYVNMLAAALQARYPLYSGSSPATVDLATAVATPPSAAGVQAVNAGVGGTNASNYLTSTTRPQVAALNPRLVVHMVGSNDFDAQRALATYKANVVAQLAALKAAITVPCVHVLVHAYERIDPGTRPITWAQYGAVLAEIAEEDAAGDVVFVDLGLAYTQSGVPGEDTLDLIDTDGVHQRDAGHAVMADLLFDALAVLMDRGVTVQSWPVTALALTNTVAPSISGTASMAQTLTASTGSWSATPDSYTYQWRRAGSDISGATSSTYQVQAADVDQAITVTVLAVKASYTSGSATSSSVTPTAGTFTNSTLPTITGTATEGQTLTAGNGTWSQTPDSHTYQWKRGGTNISGATASTYLLVTADVGSTITVTVTAVKAGYNSVAATSSATSSVAAAGGTTITNSTLPTITGTATQGQTLTASNGVWNTTPDSHAYQWKRAGVNISGATSSTYLLDAADVGSTITVTVTASKSGWTPGSATSAPTGTVQASGPATLASDTFTRANGSLGTADTGQAWATTGTWAISSNKAVPSAVGTAHIDVGTANFDVSADVIFNGGNGGLAFRVSADATTQLRLSIIDATTVSLYANTTFLATYNTLSFVSGQSYRLRVVANGDSITCYVEGVQRITHTLSTGNQTTYGSLTRVGMRNSSGTAPHFDNIEVKALA